MTNFWVGAVLLILLAFFFVLYPLRKANSARHLDRKQINEAIYQQKLEELEKEFSDGVFSQEEFDDALVELQRTLIDDAVNITENPAYRNGQTGILAAFICVLLPVAAIWMYTQYSTGYRAQHGWAQGDQAQTSSNNEIVNQLIAHLQKQPGDIPAWKELANAYFLQQDYARAVSVYEKLNEMTKSSDPDVLVGMAEASAYMINQNFSTDQLRLLRAALKIDPLHPRALWYAGVAAYQQKDFQRAVDYWDRLLTTVPTDQVEVRSALEKFLAEARANLDGSMSAENGSPSTNDSAELPRIPVSVTVDPSLKDKLPANATLFIYARAAQGPKMPLSLVRLKASDLPASVMLTEDQGMIEGMTLSAFGQVQIVARISQSGTATPQSGDLIGESPVIENTSKDEVQIVINHQLP